MNNEAGFWLDVMERQLAHVERNSVRAACRWSEYLDERGTLMNRWADLIGALATQNGRVVAGKFAEVA